MGLDWDYWIRQLDLAYLMGGIGGRPRISEKEYKKKRSSMIKKALKKKK